MEEFEDYCGREGQGKQTEEEANCGTWIVEAAENIRKAGHEGESGRRMSGWKWLWVKCDLSDRNK